MTYFQRKNQSITQETIHVFHPRIPSIYPFPITNFEKVVAKGENEKDEQILHMSQCFTNVVLLSDYICIYKCFPYFYLDDFKVLDYSFINVGSC